MLGLFAFFSLLSVVIVYLNYNSAPSVTFVSNDWEKSIKETSDFLKTRDNFCSNGVPPVIGWRKLR